MKIGVIDIFCGIGGLSYGFSRAGLDVLCGIDLDASCKYAFEANLAAPFLQESVSDISVANLRRIYSESGVDRTVLIGCAPCQPFSLYTRKYRKRGKVDRRWDLLKEFCRLALGAKPDVISMENVPRLRFHPVFLEFLTKLERAGYYVAYDVLRAEQFGVPQRRSRLVLLASRYGSIALPKPTHLGKEKTVRQTIGKLPPVRAGVRHPKDRLHGGRGLTPINLARLKATRKSGGSWKEWDPALQLDCHKKSTGHSFRSVYGRMSWDAPSPVITTQCLGIGNGKFGHPSQDRAITIREASMLQSFPKSFKLAKLGEPISQIHLARQIGNAVPPRLGLVIAKAIRSHLAAAR